MKKKQAIQDILDMIGASSQIDLYGTTIRYYGCIKGAPLRGVILAILEYLEVDVENHPEETVLIKRKSGK